MQEEGLLCARCGTILAPGYGLVLGGLDDIRPGPKQAPILNRRNADSFHDYIEQEEIVEP